MNWVLPTNKRAVLADASGYVGRLVMSEMQPYLDGIVLRSGGATWVDSTFSNENTDRVQQAYDARFPAHEYFLHYTSTYTGKFGLSEIANLDYLDDPQIVNWLKIFTNFNPSKPSLAGLYPTKLLFSHWVDHEVWWLNSQQYQEFRAGTRPKDQVAKATPAWINQTFEYFMYRLNDILRKYMKMTVPLGIYTGKWFIDEYTKQDNDYPFHRVWKDGNFKRWMVDYAYYGGDPYFNGEIQVDDFETLDEHLPPGNPSNASHFDAGWDMWQLNDKFKIPGYYAWNGTKTRADLNLMPMSSEEYRDAFGISSREHFVGEDAEEPTPTPTPTPTPVPNPVWTLEDTIGHVRELQEWRERYLGLK